MDPALSRRAAQAFRWPPIVDLPPAERSALASRIERASSWADLSASDQALIEASEANRGVVLPLPDEVGI